MPCTQETHCKRNKWAQSTVTMPHTQIGIVPGTAGEKNLRQFGQSNGSPFPFTTMTLQKQCGHLRRAMAVTMMFLTC